ncbi:GIY-YIG catalytic domain-containing protein [Varunaivibrio sulfuroxidans]|uniref:GIY-YIG catalytic domain-containing protein n=1 Tax=Varunaivibrio sulfuroxidans TaxID=1773489 RepID=A0A4R3JAG3_9PROT|nr:GIY-YIG catalytic domain-containing protein [Varunaivibrio sulfuroxidans]
MSRKHVSYSVKTPPFETKELRRKLTEFLDEPFSDPETGVARKVGDFKWGVYAFYDYEGEPIYVGQTNEKLRVRIRRHLTNQRTDAVAMSVLDPFEVLEIEVWPLPQFENVSCKGRKSEECTAARAHLNALERLIYESSLSESLFKAILNEKDPPTAVVDVSIPPSLRMSIVSKEVHGLRSHPDTRIARRALTMSKLSQVISERKVQGGLRRVLLTQATRLQWLAERRYTALGGADTVEVENGPENGNNEDRP